jgi:ornithine cyclodeaminase/alanine dehydrogenase-like protein (mu-crystallin family)
VTIQYFTDAEVRAALDWDELIAAMEGALAEFSTGRVQQPLRQWLTVEEDARYLGVMPAAAERSMGAKLVSFYPSNAGTATPTVAAAVLLFDPASGAPLAVMDGATITAMRTAAVSAAVTRRLAAPNARVLALLGSGVQAQSHLRALSRVCTFAEIRVWSPTAAHAQRFAAQHGALAMDAEAAVRGADVVVAATSARAPILRGAWLKPGAHVNSIGAPMPSWRELDDEAMSHTVVVESRAAARAEAGDVILSKTPIYAEVGEIFAGLKAIPAGQTTIYNRWAWRSRTSRPRGSCTTPSRADASKARSAARSLEMPEGSPISGSSGRLARKPKLLTSAGPGPAA